MLLTHAKLIELSRALDAARVASPEAEGYWCHKPVADPGPGPHEKTPEHGRRALAINPETMEIVCAECVGGAL